MGTVFQGRRQVESLEFLYQRVMSSLRNTDLDSTSTYHSPALWFSANNERSRVSPLVRFFSETSQYTISNLLASLIAERHKLDDCASNRLAPGRTSLVLGHNLGDNQA